MSAHVEANRVGFEIAVQDLAQDVLTVLSL